MQLLELIAILISGLMVGNEIAVGFIIHPTLSRTRSEVYSDSARALARVYGRVMPIWYAATAVLFGIVAFELYRNGTNGYRLAIYSVLLVVGAIVFTLNGLLPINNRIAGWDLNRLPDNWESEIWRWDVLHFIRVVMLMIALFLFVAACFASA